MTFDMKDYAEWKEKIGKEKAEISKLELIKICSRIASAAAGSEGNAVGFLASTIELHKILNEFFPKQNDKARSPEEPDTPEETTDEETDETAEGMEYADLKGKLFKHAADAAHGFSAEFAAVDRLTAEAMQTAKHVALLSLISDTGLSDEYYEWLRAHDYE